MGTEYLTQVENLRAAYKRALESCKERHRGGTDIEQLQQLCEKVLKSMEQWHCRTIHELREAHAQEVELLKQEKEQALAEETQATLAALDAMRKAHMAEVCIIYSYMILILLSMLFWQGQRPSLKM